MNLLQITGKETFTDEWVNSSALSMGVKVSMMIRTVARVSLDE